MALEPTEEQLHPIADYMTTPGERSRMEDSAVEAIRALGKA